MIEDTLANIESRLQNVEGLSADKRRELQGLFATLKSEIAGIKSTHADQAESIAGFAERSAQEATRAQQNPKLLNHSLAGLTSSVEELEKSHPKLVQIVNNISRALSDLGI